MLIDSEQVVSTMLLLFYPKISKYRQKPDINETNTNPSLRRITAGSLDFSCAASVTSICGCFSVSGIMPNILSCEHPRNSKLVIHHVYAAGLNSQTGFADYRVAYRMTKEAVGFAMEAPLRGLGEMKVRSKSCLNQFILEHCWLADCTSVWLFRKNANS